MAVKTADPLQEQIDAKRKEIHSDQYPISIGELSAMYRDGELDIHPEFQRYYRWDEYQKSRLIESILLGIPIPSLFVAQRSDGKWDVIDGLQRLSTVFQLMGILKDHQKNLVPPLVLTETKYLPALRGKSWSNKEPNSSLSEVQKLLIKRAKLDIKIILRESDEAAKYELFQRLNTGGSPLSDQEIRNAMLVAANPAFFKWLESLATNPAFTDCTMLSDRAYEERFDLELVLRFLVLRKMEDAKLHRIGDIGELLTEEMMDLSAKFPRIQKEEENAFKQTFAFLAEHIGADAFRRYDQNHDRFTGGFLISAFEVVGLGLGYHAKLLPGTLTEEELLVRIKSLWSNREFNDTSGSGIRASTRIPNTVRLGRKLFKP